MSESPYNRDDVVRRLERDLPSWDLKEGKLHRVYRFEDFQRAFSFMTAGALAAENLEHHPEWSNVYNRVEVSLTTHEAGGVTNLDFELAGQLESHYRDHQKSSSA